MSSRIKLLVSQLPARDDPGIIVTRLYCQVAFNTGEGFTRTRFAILDTGAPTTLIPYDIWRRCRVLKLKDTVIRGIVNRPECDLSVMEGVIGCVLRDERTTSEGLVIRAHLAPSKDVQLLLGFSGLLDRAKVYFDVEAGEAWLEI